MSKTLKLRVRFYPGEYASYTVEKKRGLFSWDTLIVCRISHYLNEKDIGNDPASSALKAALDYMNTYVANHKKYITEPYTVAQKEYWLDKENGQWNEVVEVVKDRELDISM